MYKLPIEAAPLLAELKGKRIVRATRDLLPVDYFEIYAAEERDQLAYGPLWLFFDDGTCMGFFPWLEAMAIGVEPCCGGAIPDWVHVDVTGNVFWKNAVGHQVQDVLILKSLEPDAAYYPLQIGVLLQMNNGFEVLIEYVTTGDDIRIMSGRSHLSPGAYEEIRV